MRIAESSDMKPPTALTENPRPQTSSPGARLREAVTAERPLQVAGAVNAYCAMLAERAGFRALYLHEAPKIR